VPLTNVLQFTTVKSFRNESFLRKKYLEEGASLDEIAAQILSSRKTVRRYLLHYQIPLRPPDKLVFEPERFGTRRVNGVLLADTKENKAIDIIRELRQEGRTYREIVEILNDRKVPCRQKNDRWHVKTVFKCSRYAKVSSSVLPN